MFSVIFVRKQLLKLFWEISSCFYVIFQLSCWEPNCLLLYYYYIRLSLNRAPTEFCLFLLLLSTVLTVQLSTGKTYSLQKWGVARLLTGEVKVSARKGYVTNNKRFRDWEQRAEQLVADVLSNPSVSSSVYFINSFIIVYFINSSKLALH